MTASVTKSYTVLASSTVPVSGYSVLGVTATASGQVVIVSDGVPTSFLVSTGTFYPLSIPIGNLTTITTSNGAAITAVCSEPSNPNLSSATLPAALSSVNSPFIPTFSKHPELAAQIAAGNRARELMIFDSLGAGWGSNGPGGASLATLAGTTPYNSRGRSVHGQLASLLNSAGQLTRTDAVLGWSTTTNNTNAEQSAYNPNLLLTANWRPTTNATVGGPTFQNSTDSLTLGFTPETAADSFDIFYPSAPSNYSQIAVTDVDGTFTGSPLNGAAAAAFRKSTLTRTTASTKAVSLARSGAGAGTNCPITGVIPFDSTRPMLELWNASWAGSTTGNWAGTALAGGGTISTSGRSESPIVTIGNIGADGALICLGENDSIGGVDDVTYKQNLQLIITALKAGNVVPRLVKPGRSYQFLAPNNIPASYLSAIDSLTAINNLADPIDLNTITYNPNDFFDNVHKTFSGYRKDALRILAGFA